MKTVDLGLSDAIAWNSCGKVVQQRILACLPTEHDAEKRPYVFDESSTRSLLQFSIKLITRKLGESIDAFAVFEGQSSWQAVHGVDQYDSVWLRVLVDAEAMLS